MTNKNSSNDMLHLAGLATFLRLSSKLKLLFLLWFIITMISICYLGATYTSKSNEFRTTIVIEMLVMLVLDVFAFFDIKKQDRKFKENNEN